MTREQEFLRTLLQNAMGGLPNGEVKAAASPLVNQCSDGCESDPSRDGNEHPVVGEDHTPQRHENQFERLDPSLLSVYCWAG